MPIEKINNTNDLVNLNTIAVIDIASNFAKADVRVPHYIFFKKDTDGGILMVALNKNIKIRVFSPFGDEGVTISFSDVWNKTYIEIIIPLNKKYLKLFTDETEKSLENLIAYIILTNDHFISHLQYKVFDLDTAAKIWRVAIESILDNCFFSEKK